MPAKPRWHSVHFKPNSKPMGEILVSFSISADEYQYLSPYADVDLVSMVPM